MSAPLQTVLLVSAIGFAFWWINQPLLNHYALQAFACSFFLYFLSKRFSKSKMWHFTPSHESWEMVLATFSFSLLIGATGNTSSPFFSLTFVHLFFLVMATHYSTSLVVAATLVLFHYALAPSQISTSWPTLMGIPVVLLFFLFGKHQQQELIKGQTELNEHQYTLYRTQQEEQSLVAFLSGFLLAKIGQTRELSKYPQANQEAIMGQLMLLEIEIQKMVSRFEQPTKQ